MHRSIESRPIVNVPGGQISFYLMVHRVVAPLGLLLDKDFYVRYGELPRGVHYEIEILSPALWEHPHKDKLHFRTSTSKVDLGKRFICRPRPLGLVREVEHVIIVWSIGTAFTMETGRDFTEIIKDGNECQFITYMRKLGFYI